MSSHQRETLAHRAWLVAALSYCLLLLTLSLEHWWLNPPAVDSPLLIWLARIGPLLIFIPGVRCKWPRSFAWLCFVVLFYFTSAVVDAFLGEDISGWIQTTLCVTLFISSMFYIRWHYQGLKWKLHETTNEAG
ncbi:DUF2069 domain-containing protein [Kistimonas asteriae]|uniref:DUF2069 domain-containing protein n=1 Tax=Kistimonas asteriae TaxID=517724 RepID=UPI001BAAB994|nr:DUF2069 domain-containing protein [Kistimonas asteriae]